MKWKKSRTLIALGISILFLSIETASKTQQSYSTHQYLAGLYSDMVYLLRVQDLSKRLEGKEGLGRGLTIALETAEGFHNFKHRYLSEETSSMQPVKLAEYIKELKADLIISVLKFEYFQILWAKKLTTLCGNFDFLDFYNYVESENFGYWSKYINDIQIMTEMKVINYQISEVEVFDDGYCQSELNRSHVILKAINTKIYKSEKEGKPLITQLYVFLTVAAEVELKCDLELQRGGECLTMQ